MGYLIGTLAVLVLAASTAAPAEVKSTTRLTISDGGLLIPLEITEPDVLAQSNVYAGQFIGPFAPSPAPDLIRYTVTFDIQTLNGVKRRGYVVRYVFDDSTGEAYVYLPGRGEPAGRRNGSTILRDGQDGKWHRATPEWAAAVRAYLR